jgi:flagellar motor protein MotB
LVLRDGGRAMDDESILSFNFWPSFADLMLSLVLILVLIMFTMTAVMSFGNEDLRLAESNQKNVIDLIAKAYKVEPKSLGNERFGISTNGQNTDDIIISNEPTVQIITFSDHILFNEDDFHLNWRGEQVLLEVGKVLKGKLKQIREIQIQGYADTFVSKKFESNLHLGALRAIEVFRFLQDRRVGIDPTQNLMSATTFGEYKPVQRSDNDPNYNETRLEKDNRIKELRDKNRRIELRLFYRYDRKLD